MTNNQLTIDTLVIGAGPGGLAASYRLAEAGRSTLTVERANEPGGLMRSLTHGEFTVDIGRKELPIGRLPDVDRLWSQVLGPELQAYDRRLGVLFEGRIYETERAHRGLAYGMSARDFATGAAQMIAARVRRQAAPATYEEQVYQRIGQRFAQIFYQGYDQKIGGVQWVDRSPENEVTTKKATRNLRQIMERAFSATSTPDQWRHPALGSGQVCVELHRDAADRGAEFWFDTSVNKVETNNGKVSLVQLQRGSESVVIRPKTVVSSLPVEGLTGLLDVASPRITQEAAKRRSTICVYLFLDESPRFPHSWLKVTCPTIKAGRITNYAAFSSKMVPQNKTCLCVEYCCLGQDPLLEEDDRGLRDLAVSELASVNLIDANTILDSMVVRLPGVDGATDLNDWWTHARRENLRKLRNVENLFSICQPGTDYATSCGLHAAEAIISGNRDAFDRNMDPAALFGSPTR